MVGGINENQVNLHIEFGNYYLIFKTKVYRSRNVSFRYMKSNNKDLAHRLKLVAYEERREI